MPKYVLRMPAALVSFHGPAPNVSLPVFFCENLEARPADMKIYPVFSVQKFKNQTWKISDINESNFNGTVQ